MNNFHITVHEAEPNMVRDRRDPSSEALFCLHDGEYTMELSEEEIMMIIIAAKEQGIYLEE